MALHHTFKKGQKVLVFLKDGSQLVDKYIKYTAHYLELENNIINWRDIRATTIWKPR